MYSVTQKVKGTKEKEWNFESKNEALKFFHRLRKQMGFKNSDITKTNEPYFSWKCGSTSYGEILRIDEE